MLSGFGERKHNGQTTDGRHLSCLADDTEHPFSDTERPQRGAASEAVRPEEVTMPYANTPYSVRVSTKIDMDAVRQLGKVDLYCEFSSLAEARTARSQIRYLAALFPDMSTPELATWLAGALGSRFYTADDLRLVLEGLSLNDPSKGTNEVPLDAIRTVGRILLASGNKEEAARQSGLSAKAVQAIDKATGITQSIEDYDMDTAVIAAREGWTLAKLAKVIGRDRYKARRLMRRATSVLKELGEI